MKLNRAEIEHLFDNLAQISVDAFIAESTKEIKEQPFEWQQLFRQIYVTGAYDVLHLVNNKIDILHLRQYLGDDEPTETHAISAFQ